MQIKKCLNYNYYIFTLPKDCLLSHSVSFYFYFIFILFFASIKAFKLINEMFSILELDNITQFVNFNITIKKKNCINWNKAEIKYAY